MDPPDDMLLSAVLNQTVCGSPDRGAAEPVGYLVSRMDALLPLHANG